MWHTYSLAVSLMSVPLPGASSHVINHAELRGLFPTSVSLMETYQYLLRFSHIPHSEHHCESRQCPIGCQLCKRLCSEHDHLHGLDTSAVHLCGYVQCHVQYLWLLKHSTTAKSMRAQHCVALKESVKLRQPLSRWRPRSQVDMRASNTPRYVFESHTRDHD